MKIQRAIKKAKRQGKRITRAPFTPYVSFSVGSEHVCLMLYRRETPDGPDKKIGTLWNPSVEDMLANDWVII